LTDGVEPPMIASNLQIDSLAGLFFANAQGVWTCNGTEQDQNMNTVVQLDPLTLDLISSFVDTRVAPYNFAPPYAVGWSDAHLVTQGGVDMLFVNWYGSPGIMGYQLVTNSSGTSLVPNGEAFGVNQSAIWIAVSGIEKYLVVAGYILEEYTVDGFNSSDTALVTYSLDSSLNVQNTQTLSFPPCADNLTPCSFAYVQPFINQYAGQEIVVLYQQRGESFYLVDDTTQQLVPIGVYGTHCDSVYVAGFVGNDVVLYSSVSLTCICQSITGACPPALLVTVSPPFSPAPPPTSKSVAASMMTLALVFMLLPVLSAVLLIGAF